MVAMDDTQIQHAYAQMHEAVAAFAQAAQQVFAAIQEAFASCAQRLTRHRAIVLSALRQAGLLPAPKTTIMGRKLRRIHLIIQRT